MGAMTSGLPCVGSSVGGIPKLINSSEIVPPNNVVALSTKLRELTADPERLAQLSERNLRLHAIT